jgi:formate hydrogenlyase subunit 3
MVITAHGFAMPVKENFAAVLKLRHWLNPVGWVPGWQTLPRPRCSAVWRWLSWRCWW